MPRFVSQWCSPRVTCWAVPWTLPVRCRSRRSECSSVRSRCPSAAAWDRCRGKGVSGVCAWAAGGSRWDSIEAGPLLLGCDGHCRCSPEFSPALPCFCNCSVSTPSKTDEAMLYRRRARLPNDIAIFFPHIPKLQKCSCSSLVASPLQSLKWWGGFWIQMTRACNLGTHLSNLFAYKNWSAFKDHYMKWRFQERISNTACFETGVTHRTATLSEIVWFSACTCFLAVLYTWDISSVGLSRVNIKRVGMGLWISVKSVQNHHEYINQIPDHLRDKMPPTAVFTSSAPPIAVDVDLSQITVVCSSHTEESRTTRLGGPRPDPSPVAALVRDWMDTVVSLYSNLLLLVF